MKNLRLVFWISFGGAILAVLAVVGFYYLKDARKMSELREFYGNWRPAQGKINAFQALFPKEPEYASQDLPIPESDKVIKQEIYVGGSDNMSFFLAASLYPEDITGGEEENLRSALEGMIGAMPDAKLISSRYVVPFSGKNYLEFEILSAGNEVRFKGREYVYGPSLYQVYASYPESAYSDNEYFYFVNSFSI